MADILGCDTAVLELAPLIPQIQDGLLVSIEYYAVGKDTDMENRPEQLRRELLALKRPPSRVSAALSKSNRESVDTALIDALPGTSLATFVALNRHLEGHVDMIHEEVSPGRGRVDMIHEEVSPGRGPRMGWQRSDRTRSDTDIKRPSTVLKRACASSWTDENAALQHRQGQSRIDTGMRPYWSRRSWISPESFLSKAAVKAYYAEIEDDYPWRERPDVAAVRLISELHHLTIDTNRSQNGGKWFIRLQKDASASSEITFHLFQSDGHCKDMWKSGAMLSPASDTPLLDLDRPTPEQKLRLQSEGIRGDPSLPNVPSRCSSSGLGDFVNVAALLCACTASTVYHHDVFQGKIHDGLAPPSPWLPGVSDAHRNWLLAGASIIFVCHSTAFHRRHRHGRFQNRLLAIGSTAAAGSGIMYHLKLQEIVLCLLPWAIVASLVAGCQVERVVHQRPKLKT